MLYRRESITVRLLDAFFRNIGIFFLCVIGVSSIVATALLIRSQTYVATASIRVLLDTDIERSVGLGQPFWISPANKHAARFGDLMQDLRPAPVGFVSTALDAAKLSKPMNTDPEARDKRFQQFKKAVFTTQNSNELFSIGLVWENKQECEKLVEALQTRFIESIGETREAEGIATVKFLDSQIEEYTRQLQEAEDALMEFRSKNAGKLPEATETELEQLALLRMERNYLGVTSQNFALRRQGIEKRLKEIKPESVLMRTIGSNPLVDEIRGLQAKRNSLIVQNWKPDSLPVKSVDDQIAALQRELDRQMKADPTGELNVTETKLQDNPEYRTLEQQRTEVNMQEREHKAQMAQLEQRIAEHEKRIAQLPVAKRTLVEKTRNQEVIQKQYQDLWQRREQARLKASVDRVTETSKLIPQTLIRAMPTLGTAKKLVLLGTSIVLGLVVGCIMILVREWMDVSLRYVSDAERLLGVPVLASLPASPDLQFPLSRPRQGRLRARVTSSTEVHPALSAPPKAE